MIYSAFLTIALFFLSSFSINNSVSEENKNHKNKFEHATNLKSKADLIVESVYHNLNANQFILPQFDSFSEALKGYYRLKEKGLVKKEILTLVDFSLSSNTKRLWVIDLNDKKILFNSLVAHGKNTGEEFARKFSNTESSLQSSLGFYVTESTYNGSNGFSLKLHGMDKGFNDRALQRAIVMHGADYVSEDFIKSQRRIGRSWGCPAVPTVLAKPIINTIKDKNVIFIYYPDQNYLSSSVWLNA